MVADATEAQEAGSQVSEQSEFGKLTTGPVRSPRLRGLVEQMGDILQVAPGKVVECLRGVWGVSKGQEPLTPQEMFTGLSLAVRFGLDPISREVYVTRDNKGRLMTIVAIDGWVKILNRTPDYDGFEVELGFDDGGKLEWAETTIYSKARSHPASYRAYMREYMAISGYMASKIPWHMLRIFSLRHAARLFAPLGAGVMLEEEADSIFRDSNDTQDAEGNALATQLAEMAAKSAGKPKAPSPAEAPQQPPPAAEQPPAEDARPESDDSALGRGELPEDAREFNIVGDLLSAITTAPNKAALTKLRLQAEENRGTNEINGAEMQGLLAAMAARASQLSDPNFGEGLDRGKKKK